MSGTDKQPPTLFEDTPLLASGTKSLSRSDKHDTFTSYFQQCGNNDRDWDCNKDSIDSINPTDIIDLTASTSTVIDTGRKDVGEKSGLKLFSSLSGNRKYTLILITMATFWAGAAHSLLPPFYTTEAVEKGMSIGLVGVAYGISQVVVFVTAPIFGNFLIRLEPKFVFLSGIFLGGSCNVLLGTLEFCPPGKPFVVMSLLIRSVEAVGFSGFVTSSFAIVSSEFKDHVALSFGILQTGNGLGLVLGPIIGGVLFDLGGFGLPFYVVGGSILLNGMVVYRLLPLVEEIPAKRQGSMLTLLRSPMVVVPMCSVFIGAVGINTYEATFAQHMVPLGFSVETVGLLFSSLAGVHTLMSFIWGYVSDASDIQAPLIVGGHLVFGVGFLLLGPSVVLVSFVPFNLETILVGMVCIGVSFGCAYIPTLKCMVVGATELGFENNTETYALVAGLFNCVQTFGGFVGPVGVGYLVQRFEYPVAYTVIGMSSFFMMFVSLAFFVHRSIDPPNSRVTRDNVVYTDIDAARFQIPFNERQPFPDVSTANARWSSNLKTRTLRKTLRLAYLYGIKSEMI